MNQIPLRLVIAFGALVFSTGCGACHHSCCDKPAPSAQAEPLRRIAAADLDVKRQGAAPIYIYDNNSDERYAKGHVPGAVHLAKEAVRAESLPPNKEAMLVFYCGGPRCMACHEAAKAAIALGYSNVWIMPDGISGWEAASLPTEN